MGSSSLNHGTNNCFDENHSKIFTNLLFSMNMTINNYIFIIQWRLCENECSIKILWLKLGYTNIILYAWSPLVNDEMSSTSLTLLYYFRHGGRTWLQSREGRSRENVNFFYEEHRNTDFSPPLLTTVISIQSLHSVEETPHYLLIYVNLEIAKFCCNPCDLTVLCYFLEDLKKCLS